MAYLFSSESVSEGHPDKVADQISDAILDDFLRQDPDAKVACETFVSTGLVVVGGEVRAEAYVDIQQIARKVGMNEKFAVFVIKTAVMAFCKEGNGIQTRLFKHIYKIFALEIRANPFNQF